MWKILTALYINKKSGKGITCRFFIFFSAAILFILLPGRCFPRFLCPVLPVVLLHYTVGPAAFKNAGRNGC